MLRWTLAVIGLVLVAPRAWGQDDAQKLYEAMQQKLAKAKAQQVDFAIEGKFDGNFAAKGTLTLASGNRFHLTMDGKDGERQFKALSVSDGKTVAVRFERDGKPNEYSSPAPVTLVEQATGLLNQGGVLLTVLHLAEKLPPVKGVEVKPSGFKMLAKEKVGDRMAAVIEYHLSGGAFGKDSATCKVWIDVQSQLPLKRTVIRLPGDGKVESSITETYARWELDPALPDKLFTLPK